MGENSSYEVYLWQDRSGDFIDKAVEVFDGKGEVRLHEGEPPKMKMPAPTPCPTCARTSWNWDMLKKQKQCGQCGEIFSQERGEYYGYLPSR